MKWENSINRVNVNPDGIVFFNLGDNLKLFSLDASAKYSLDIRGFEEILPEIGMDLRENKTGKCGVGSFHGEADFTLHVARDLFLPSGENNLIIVEAKYWPERSNSDYPIYSVHVYHVICTEDGVIQFLNLTEELDDGLELEGTKLVGIPNTNIELTK